MQQARDAGLRIDPSMEDVDKNGTEACSYMAGDGSLMAKALGGDPKRVGQMKTWARILVSYKCPEQLARYDELAATVAG